MPAGHNGHLWIAWCPKRSIIDTRRLGIFFVVRECR